MSKLLLFTLLALASVCAHAYGTLDRRFGDGGFVRLGFQPVMDEVEDYGIVACSGPEGTLLISGVASGGRRLVTAWLTEAGTLARDFGLEGKQSVDLARGPTFNARGTCLPDGKAVLAVEATDAQQDGIIVVYRIDPLTGLPDAGFGTQGGVEIDLDRLQAGLGRFEVANYLSPGRNGELLVSGQYSLGSTDDRWGGFVLRLSANGTLLASTFAHVDDPGVTAYASVLPAADGTLWAPTMRMLPDGQALTSVVRLDEGTLHRIDTLQSPISVDLSPARAVMLDGETMALSGYRQGGKPFVAVVRADRLAVLQLPMPGTVQSVVTPQLAALPDGSLLYAATFREETQFVGRGEYFARIRRNLDGTLALDTEFGTGGVLATKFPRNAACPERPVEQYFRRFTFWKGRPTAIGFTESSCDVPDADYLVLRLALDGIHGSGFE